LTTAGCGTEVFDVDFDPLLEGLGGLEVGNFTRITDPMR